MSGTERSGSLLQWTLTPDPSPVKDGRGEKRALNCGSAPQ